MKFHRVEVENWRPFRGKSSMDMAVTPDQTITLVFGKNGGGKTSMLTAIYWCLYGKMDLEDGKGDQNLVNNYAVQQAGVTKKNPAQATVVLFASGPQDGGEYLYRISRQQNGYDSGGSRKERPGEFIVQRVTPSPGFRDGDDIQDACDHPDSSTDHFKGNQAQDVIERLLPQNLAKYFFYPGETLSFPFRNDKSSIKLLKEFLREISGQSKFEPFNQKIQKSTKTLKAKSKERADADKETRQIQADIDTLKADLEKKREELLNNKAELAAVETRRQNIVDQLGQIEAVKDIIGAAERARSQENSDEINVKAAEESLTNALGKAYFMVATPVFDAFAKVFADGDYPNDISNGLVEQLKDTMKCICDRDLTEEMLKKIVPRSATDDSVVKRMLSLHSHATELRTSDADREEVDEAVIRLKEKIGAHKASSESHAAARAKLKEEAGGLDQVKKDKLVSQEEQCDRDIRSLERKIGSGEQDIASRKEGIERREREKQHIAPRGDQAVHSAAELAGLMGELLEAIQDKQADVARNFLQIHINENYVVYKQNIEVTVDSDLGVKIIDRTGGEARERPVGDLSGAETALLTYAFAAAAAKMLPEYQTLDKLLTTTPTFSTVEHIPLVVDAPFSNLGHEYKRRVTDLIAQGFSQVIMFTESTDTDILTEYIEDIGAEYLVHYRGEVDDDVDGSFTWRGKTYTYVSSGDAGAARSTLERIEI